MQPDPKNAGRVGDGDPSGIELLTPDHPDFPSVEALLQLKGAPAEHDVRQLTPEEVVRYREGGHLLEDDGPLIETRRPKLGGLRLLG